MSVSSSTRELFFVTLILVGTFIGTRSVIPVDAVVEPIGCRWANVTAMPFCGDYVGYQIANDSNDAELDAQALFQHQQECSFYAYKPYACSKYFVRCMNATATAPAYLEGICQDWCMKGKDVDDCSKLWNDKHYLIECSYDYITPAPNCVGEDVLGLPSSVKDAWYWQIGLGVGLGVLLVIGIIVVWRHHKRDSISADDLAKHDAKKRAKLEKKEKKQKAKDKEKYRSEGETEGNGEVRLSVNPRDIELGEVRPANLNHAGNGSSHTTPAIPARGLITMTPAQRAAAAHQQAKAAAAASAATSSTDTKKDDKDKTKEHKKSKSSRKHKEKDARSTAPLLPDEPRAPGAESPLPDQSHAPPSVHLHMLKGDEDAWKSGQPIRVAPPDQ